jgi:FK506-binding protein 4/5
LYRYDEAAVTYSVSAPDGGGEIVASTDAEFTIKSAPFHGLGKVLTMMKEGESCLVKMTNEYCAGLPGAPAAADVTVTLRSYKNVDPICDGAGTKKTTTEGEGYDTPNDGATCVISYVTKLASTVGGYYKLNPVDP